MKTSVVMAVHGNWPVARRALEALAPELGEEREVIVVDDASPDAAPDGLPATTIVRNDRNLGFGPSCNRGAELARGRAPLLPEQRLDRRAGRARRARSGAPSWKARR